MTAVIYGFDYLFYGIHILMVYKGGQDYIYKTYLCYYVV